MDISLIRPGTCVYLAASLATASVGAQASPYFVQLQTCTPSCTTYNTGTAVTASYTSSNVSGTGTSTVSAQGTNIHSFSASVADIITTSPSFAAVGALYNDAFGIYGAATVTIGETYIVNIPSALPTDINHFTGFFHVRGSFDDPNPPVVYYSPPATATYSFGIGNFTNLDPAAGLVSTFSYTNIFQPPFTTPFGPSFHVDQGGVFSYDVFGNFDVSVQGPTARIPIEESLTVSTSSGTVDFSDPVQFFLDLSGLPVGTTVVTASGQPPTSENPAVVSEPSSAGVFSAFATLIALVGLANHRRPGPGISGSP